MVEFDLHGQNSRVALLAVDKAFYGLHADNRLTPKQVTASPTLGSRASVQHSKPELLLPVRRPSLPCSRMTSAAPTVGEQTLEVS